jgi:hypothetical protein
MTGLFLFICSGKQHRDTFNGDELNITFLENGMYL